MSQEQRKEAIIAEMKALENHGDAIEDRLINLGQYQQYALVQTFGREEAPKKTFSDLIGFYEKMNLAFDLGIEDEIKALTEGADSLQSECTMLIEENKAKEILHERIEQHFKAHGNAKFVPVLKDVRFNYDGKTRRYDEILVTNGGVIVIEWRVPKHNIGIDEDGNYTEFFYKDVRVEKYSMTDLVKRGESILAGVLKECGFDGAPIHTIIVFGGTLAYANLCSELTTMYFPQLKKYLFELGVRKELPQESQRNIFNCLKDVAEGTEPVEYNFFTEFVEAYADIRSKVEDMLKKSKNKKQ